MNKGERTKELILNKGMLHSSQYGIADITIGTMANLCELSRTGVISHFKNKDDMQIAILDYSEKQFLEHVLKPSRHESALAQLKSLLILWLDWTERVFQSETTSCPFVKALVEYEHRQDSPVRQHAYAQQQKLLSFLEALITKAQEQGEIKSEYLPADAALEIYSLYVGLSVASPLLPAEKLRSRLESTLLSNLKKFEK